MSKTEKIHGPNKWDYFKPQVNGMIVIITEHRWCWRMDNVGDQTWKIIKKRGIYFITSQNIDIEITTQYYIIMVSYYLSKFLKQMTSTITFIRNIHTRDKNFLWAIGLFNKYSIYSIFDLQRSFIFMWFGHIFQKHQLFSRHDHFA